MKKKKNKHSHRRLVVGFLIYGLVMGICLQGVMAQLGKQEEARLIGNGQTLYRYDRRQHMVVTLVVQRKVLIASAQKQIGQYLISRNEPLHAAAVNELSSASSSSSAFVA